jgi:hypothetical protein
MLVKFKKSSGYRDKAASLYVDLTPVSNADPRGVYCRALEEAMGNDNVKNIALTGPYGSGKSSIVKTFENSTKLKFLNISLATFSDPKRKADDGGSSDKLKNENNILIERSILQQMLYGANADNLPYSRFKKITTPKMPQRRALFFTGFIFSCVYLYSNKEGLSSFKILSPDWILLSNLFFVFFVASFIAYLAFRSSH